MLTYELSGDADTMQSLPEVLPGLLSGREKKTPCVRCCCCETGNYKYFAESCRVLETFG
jgi:hypothetical protein